MAKSSTTTVSPKRKPSKRSTIFVTILLAIALMAALALLLFQKSRSPEAVFNAMVENNLRTSSVTRSITQESTGQELDQTIQLLSGEQHVAHGNTVLTQTGGQEEAVVETQSIGTPRTDYVRYTDIETTQKNLAGSEYDFSEVLGIWGKSPTSVETTGQLYNESILGVVPIANLSAESRRNLMQLVRSEGVYEIDYSQVRKGNTNGRPTYTYNVTVKPTAYIAFLKQFGNEAGLSQLADLDPSTYENATPLQFEITVDILTRRLQQISFENGRQETFGSYGLHQSVELPEQTIPIMELQSRIQTVQ